MKDKNNYHIAFFVIPANGHTNPSLGIVSALVERGYRVTYATRDYFASRIHKLGAEPIIYGSEGGRRLTLLNL